MLQDYEMNALHSTRGTRSTGQWEQLPPALIIRGSGDSRCSRQTFRSSFIAIDSVLKRDEYNYLFDKNLGSARSTKSFLT